MTVLLPLIGARLLAQFWPLLALLSAAGWGIACSRAMGLPTGNAEPENNLFTHILLGIVALTALAFVANFGFGLGTGPGGWTVASGLLLLAGACFRRREWLTQVGVLVGVFVIVARVFGGMRLTYDAGLYHIPYMSWVAEEAVPYGLANLEGRLGFNSAWLMYVSALRLSDVLGWRHIVHAEILIRTLFFSWLVWRFAVTWRGDWSGKSLLYVLTMVFGFVLDPGRETSTDVAANLCALIAWVTFCELWNDEQGEASIARYRLAILTTAVAFACSIKLSVAPIAVLPVAAAWRAGVLRDRQALRRSMRWGAPLAVYVAVWTVRGWFLSGCLLYPSSITCLDTEWSAPEERVRRVAAAITGWAKHPDPGFKAFMANPDMEWFPAWLERFGRSTTVLTILAVLALVALSELFVRRRPDRDCQASWRTTGGSTAVVTSVVGISFWFITAPDPRFSWVFFAMLCISLMYWSLHRAAITFPIIHMRPLERRRKVLGLLVGVSLAAAILRPVPRAPLVPPLPRVETISSRNRWQATRPLDGEQCWTRHPCTHDNLDALSVRQRGGRLLFTWQVSRHEGEP